MSMRPRDNAGASGIFRFVRHRTAGMKGSGPNGEVRFQDLFKCDKHGLGIRDEKGRIIPQHEERVVQDVEVRNKFTRRGLAYMMHTALKQHGGTYAPPEITYDATIGPFNAFMLLADETGPPAKAADARVTWDESDGEFDLKIPKSNAVAGEGKRGLLFSDTSNTYLRRIYTRYPTTNPYRELEYVFYAQANVAPLVSGDNNYIDNFPISAICIAAGEACGHDEANSQVGIRAVLGVPPIHQCVSDRVYVHEGVAGHEYLAAETLGTYGDGFVQSSDDGAGHTGDKAFDGDVEDEAISGVPDWGDKWVSLDNGDAKRVGRIWAAQKTIRGVRIVLPPGINSNFAPNSFELQYLDPAKAPGGDPNNLIPEDDSHWTLLSAKSGVGITIYDSADRGIEYDFGAEYACHGIRMANILSIDVTRKVEISELLCYEEMDPIEITSVLANNVLRIRTDGVTYRDFTINDVGPVILVADIITELNRQLRGYELQAVRSDFGFLWIRGTVAGNNSTVDVDSVANGSTVNTVLGMNSAGQTKTGVTQSVTKAFDDALTITYRVAISGDLPV